VSKGGLSRCGVSASANRVEREAMAGGDVKILGVFQTGGLLFGRAVGRTIIRWMGQPALAARVS